MKEGNATENPSRHDLATIRTLMQKAFEVNELKRLCLNNPEFRPILAELGSDPSLNQVIDQVIAYNETRLLWDPFLVLVKEENPRQYERFASQLMISAAELAKIPCPYRGLDPFEAEHARFYFGREATIEQLVSKLQAHALVVVVGPSGCGKSSLMRAGLQVARERGTLPGGERWQVRFFLPGADPLRALAAPLVEILEDEPSEIDRLVEVRKLADGLAQGTILIADVAARLRDKDSGGTHLLLVADQFEETYTECPDEGRRRAFVEALLAAASETNISIALTLRADFYGQVLSDQVLGKEVAAGQLNVLPMSQKELREVIEQPALEIGRSFEPGLVTRILEDVAGEPGNLPLLEFALTELWKRQSLGKTLTHKAYELTGQVEGAIARQAEKAFAALSAQHLEETTQRIFRRLTHYRQGPEGIRRRVPVRDLVTPGTPREEVETVLETLADARLLVRREEKDSQGATVEVSHEALLRSWKRLKDWLAADQSFGLWREKLAADLERWQEAEGDEWALLKGTPLAKAKDWLEDRGDDLNDRERTYIAESLALQERQAKEQEREAKEREAQRQRELEATRRLAEAHRQRAEEQARSSRRLRSLAAGLALVLFVALGAGLVAFLQKAEAEHLRLVSLAQALAAEAPRQQEQGKQDELGALLARQAFLVNREVEGDALSQVDQALRATLGVSYFSRLLGGRDLAEALGMEWGALYAPVYSSDGQLLAAGTSKGTILVWDLGQPGSLPLVLEGHGQEIHSLAFSPQEPLLASSSDDGQVILWDVTQDQDPQTLFAPKEGRSGALAFSPDGQRLALGGLEGNVVLWDVAGGRQATVLPAHHQGQVSALAFLPSEGQVLASGGSDGQVLLWDLDAPEPEVRHALLHHQGQVRSVAFSPNAKILASGGSDGDVVLWDVASGERLSLFPRVHEGAVTSLAFDLDGRVLASGCNDQLVRLWFLAGSGEALRGSSPNPAILRGHLARVTGVDFRPDGQGVTSTSGDGTLRTWLLAEPAVAPQVLLDHDQEVRSVAFQPNNNQMLASAGSDRVVRLWDLAQPGVGLTRLPGPRQEVSSVAFSPDGQRLVSASTQGETLLWDLGQAPVPAPSPIAQGGGSGQVAFGADGQLLAVGGSKGNILLWDVLRNERQGLLPQAHEGRISALAFDPDGRLLASGGEDQAIVIRDVQQPGSTPSILREHGDRVSALAFRPHGRTLASGSWDGRVLLWDLDALDARPVDLPGPASTRVYALAFSPDGGLLAAARADGSIRLWSLDQTEIVPIDLMGHEGQVFSVSFSRDGQTLASAGTDHTVRLWSLYSTEDLAEMVCTQVGRNLTQAEWDQFVRTAYRCTCPDLPPGIGAPENACKDE